MTDLWPTELGRLKVKSPAAILREQATFLGNKTQNVVIANVRPISPNQMKKGTFYYTFELEAPALGGYTYDLFSINHGMKLYPVIFMLGHDLQAELLPNAEKDAQLVGKDQESFENTLKAIFASGHAGFVVNALVAQSEGLKPTDRLPF